MATINGNDFSFNRSSELNLAELDGSNGFVINGINESDRSGRSVNTAGDVNGDGFDDLLIGADGADPNGQYAAGENYVVFGRDFTGQGNLPNALGNDELTTIAGNNISGQPVLSLGLADGTSITF